MLITEAATIKTYYDALLARDASFLGVYLVGVKTTGVFCLPTCRARKPLLKNVAFYTTIQETEEAGFRACKICKPKAPLNWAPEYIAQALQLLESLPEEKITDAMLKEHGISPVAVRRWFRQRHGITFHAFQRRHRMVKAQENLRTGKSITEVAFGSGYESLSGFAAAFRRETGKSPSDRED